MFVVPKLNAVAIPELLIRATLAADELHVTCAVRSSVLLSEKTPVAVNCKLPLIPSVGAAGVTTMELNVAGVTVSTVVVASESYETVMVD